MANVNTSNLQQIVAALRTPAQTDPNANKVAVAKSYIQQKSPLASKSIVSVAQDASTFAPTKKVK